MPLPWFRRKPDDPKAAPEAVAPASPVVIETEPVAPAPEVNGAETEAQKRKRRRGSRGGKGRKKPGTTAAAATHGARLMPAPHATSAGTPDRKSEPMVSTAARNNQGELPGPSTSGKRQ